MSATSVRPAKRGVAKLGIAVAAAAALTVAGTGSAFAADKSVTSGDVAGYESNDTYAQWHIGSVNNTELTSEDSLEFGACSVTTKDVPADSESSSTITQVLKGFTAATAPTATADTGVAPLESLINSIEIEVESGSVTVQVPTFEFEDGADEPSAFTTYRNASGFGEGTHKIAGKVLTASGGVGDALPAGSTFADVLSGYGENLEDGAAYSFIGVGFTGTEGTVVKSISFGGDTYYFGEDGEDCFPEDDSDNGTPGTEVPGSGISGSLGILGSLGSLGSL